MAEKMQTVCDQCGQDFYVSMDDQLGSSPTEYCSRLCRMRADQ